eukprot:1320236-Pleurochrysis_carterae.AAC.1
MKRLLVLACQRFVRAREQCAPLRVGESVSVCMRVCTSTRECACARTRACAVVCLLCVGPRRHEHGDEHVEQRGRLLLGQAP